MGSHLNFLTHKRRSVRRFAEQPVPEEALADILEAGLKAPTSKNTRATFFVVIEEEQQRLYLSECRANGSQFLAKAPIVVVVCADSERTGRPYSDCAVAAAFMQLAVTDNDLGSCWCHVEDSPSPHCGTAEEYVKEYLHLPASTRVLCMLGIGEVEQHSHLEPRNRPTEWERIYIKEYQTREAKA